MMQTPRDLREPALNLRDGLGDRAGDQPLCSKELRRDLREPARSNQVTRADACARTRDAAIRTIAQVRAGVRRWSGSFLAKLTGEVRGNSRGNRQTLLRCPVRFS
jgi:hypothetical protein